MKIKEIIDRFQDFIEEHIMEDECDGIERTLVEFNYNDWIRFKKKLKKEQEKKNENQRDN